jgi:hypothetical protein
VVSVATVDDARCALSASHFDLAMLHLARDKSSGLDVLPELIDSAIPVICYSAQGANPPGGSRSSLDSQIAIMRKQAAFYAPDAGRPT